MGGRQQRRGRGGGQRAAWRRLVVPAADFVLWLITSISFQSSLQTPRHGVTPARHRKAKDAGAA